MARLAALQADLDKEARGVRLHYALGVYAIIGRMGPAFQQTLRTLQKPHERLMRAGGPEADRVARELLCRALAKHVLLGWENLDEDEEPKARKPADAEGYRKLEDGKWQRVIPYSEDKAYEILMDDAYHDFSEWVLACAQDAELFRKEHVEGSAKN